MPLAYSTSGTLYGALMSPPSGGNIRVLYLPVASFNGSTLVGLSRCIFFL